VADRSHVEVVDTADAVATRAAAFAAALSAVTAQSIETK